MTPEQITADARTVAHLGTYLEELKQRVSEVQALAKVIERGYFTPTEDELAQRLLISYWQTRAALFEVITSVRYDEELDETWRPRAFLVAYAAAVLLVDAARFLRESFDENAEVIRKLNEPIPPFGVPERVYSTVQKSLTSSRHAWHLYHAMQFFDEHEAELRDAGREPWLAPTLEIIDRLGDRVRVPAEQYIVAKLGVRKRRVVEHVQQRILRVMYRLQKLGSALVSDLYVRPGHDPHIPEAVAAQIRDTIQPGDVFITRKEFALTNYFLPGYWPHAALYLGDPQRLAELGLSEQENFKPRWERLLGCDMQEPRRVLESMKDGVRIRSVSSPLHSDALVILRPRLNSDDIVAALGRGMAHEGKPYDFDFDFTRSDRLVCTEVVYRSYEGVGGVAFQLSRRAGRMTLAAEDLIEMALQRQHFEPLGVYAPAHGATLLTDAEGEAVVKATHVVGA